MTLTLPSHRRLQLAVFGIRQIGRHRRPELVILGGAVSLDGSPALNDLAIAPSEYVDSDDVELLIRVVRSVATIARDIGRILIAGRGADVVHVKAVPGELTHLFHEGKELV